MKKLIAVLLTIISVFSFAFAEEVPTEIVYAGEPVTLVDEEGIQFVLQSFEDSALPGHVNVNYLYINDAGFPVGARFSEGYINDWKTSSQGFSIDLNAGKKIKEDETFQLKNTDAESLQDIKSFDFTITFTNKDTYKTVIKKAFVITIE